MHWTKAWLHEGINEQTQTKQFQIYSETSDFYEKSILISLVIHLFSVHYDLMAFFDFFLEPITAGWVNLF
jgi:hypothetical protein